MMSKFESQSPIYRQRTFVGSLALTILLLGMLPLGGCRICADCEDLAYPAYGGIWQRTRREDGRVGSIFDPGGAKTSELVDRDEPDNPDEIIRQRRSTKDGISDPAESDTKDEKDTDADEDSPKSQSDKPDSQKLRDRSLEDIEGEDNLREKSLDDIEVRIIPGRAPVMVKTK